MCVCVCVLYSKTMCDFKIVQILKIYVSLNCLSQFFLELQKKRIAVVYVLMCFICMICFIEYTGET